MTETTALEETAEVVERVAKAHLNGTTKPQQIAILGIVALTSAAVAGSLAHLLTKKALTLKFEEVLTNEVEAARHFYARSNKTDIDGRPLSPKDVFEGLQVDDETKEAMKTYSGQGPVEITADPPVARAEELEGGTYVPSADGTEMIPEGNVFDGREPVEDDWDFIQEVANRTKDKPYIISHDEYYEGTDENSEFDQDELTWYAGDGILADSQGIETRDPEETVGLAHMAMFGHGSLDANTVYIRNHKLGLDFEVTRSPGKFAHEVLALEVDPDEGGSLRHADRRMKPRRMRESDE